MSAEAARKDWHVESWEQKLLAICPDYPCPRCGLGMTSEGNPWEWWFVCPECGNINDCEL